MRKKYVFAVLLSLCVVALLAVLGVKVSLHRSAENISVRFTDFHKADAQEVADFPFYTLDESGVFWGDFAEPSAEDELRAEPTKYRVEDYERDNGYNRQSGKIPYCGQTPCRDLFRRMCFHKGVF